MVEAVTRGAPVPQSAAPINPDRAAMIAFMQQVLDLDPKTLGIVRMRFKNPVTPLKVIARRFRISTQAAHYRLKKLANTWPGVRILVGLNLKR
jgi:hypothetical protein